MNPDDNRFTRYLEALKESLIFGKLPTKILRDMLEGMVPETWKAHSFRNSTEVSSYLHFIVQGKIKVFQINPNSGREHTIFILSNGNVFDILNFVENLPHDVYWETLEELEILGIQSEDMRNWIVQYPILNNAIFMYLAQRMHTLEELASDMTLHSTLVRLSKLLLKYINGESHKLEVINNLPNDEIASLIGTTRAVVNRHIQELKRCGAISVKRKQIDVKNLNTLLSIAEERVLP